MVRYGTTPGLCEQSPSPLLHIPAETSPIGVRAVYRGVTAQVQELVMRDCGSSDVDDREAGVRQESPISADENIAPGLTRIADS